MTPKYFAKVFEDERLRRMKSCEISGPSCRIE
jgi:hypothetical protein